MSEHPERRVPWYLWPFHALWRLLSFVLATTGRLLCAILGLALMIVGSGACAQRGRRPASACPLVLLGFLLLVRALF